MPAQGRDAPDNVDVGVAAGELQLADGTWVVVDEMGLEDGVLKERGERAKRQRLSTDVDTNVGCRRPKHVTLG